MKQLIPWRVPRRASGDRCVHDISCTSSYYWILRGIISICLTCPSNSNLIYSLKLSITGVGCSERQPRFCLWGSGTGAIGTTISPSHPMGFAIDFRRKSGAVVVTDSHEQCRCRYDNDAGDSAWFG